MEMVSGGGSLSQGNDTASTTYPEMMFVDYYLWRTESFSGSKWHELLLSNS